ncbi:hypothetical protein G6K88_14030 [Agrobacterium rhizogenes]|uniref:hypothetical protein n=1 Tax=Rhizobium rhizogenes TaxID=359 RepID=UPI00115D33ED|nr:hypothetical protein [Rhizobium rhizogenes]NTI03138.1 hypothetical protein [Rhizobium rhizogenes]NTI09942.1 hypothetical protein [Rhizobium rhizogenes]TRB21533.1 hypothetical protein EXN70_21745 [Rhizobium rhizogenes]
MEDEEALSTSRIILRVGTLVAVAAMIAYLSWVMFSEKAALNRLSETAQNYHYTESCDADGNLVATGQPNCVDLNRYMFVYGPISKAFRRACSGKAAEMLSFQEGKVSTFEINLVDKMLLFRAREGGSSPC